jgi:hypothetical protein
VIPAHRPTLAHRPTPAQHAAHDRLAHRFAWLQLTPGRRIHASRRVLCTQALARQHGPIEGAELLNVYMNAYFRRLIDVIIKGGGDIIKFAGDAMQVIWRVPEPSAAAAAAAAAATASAAHTAPTSAALGGKDAGCSGGDGHDEDDDDPDPASAALPLQVLHAARCCMSMLNDLHGFSPTRGVTLTLHMGIGAGKLTAFTVGGHLEKWCARGRLEPDAPLSLGHASYQPTRLCTPCHTPSPPPLSTAIDQRQSVWPWPEDPHPSPPPPTPPRPPTGSFSSPGSPSSKCQTPPSERERVSSSYRARPPTRCTNLSVCTRRAHAPRPSWQLYGRKRLRREGAAAAGARGVAVEWVLEAAALRRPPRRTQPPMGTRRATASAPASRPALAQASRPPWHRGG